MKDGRRCQENIRKKNRAEKISMSTYSMRMRIDGISCRSTLASAEMWRNVESNERVWLDPSRFD